jgi:hypothetical protein
MQLGSFASRQAWMLTPFSSRYHCGKPLSGFVGPTAATPPVPVPVIGIESGELAALESSRIWVGWAPTVSGMNSTCSVQVPPAGTVAPVEQLSARIT